MNTHNVPKRDRRDYKAPRTPGELREARESLRDWVGVWLLLALCLGLLWYDLAEVVREPAVAKAQEPVVTIEPAQLAHTEFCVQAVKDHDGKLTGSLAKTCGKRLGV